MNKRELIAELEQIKNDVKDVKRKVDSFRNKYIVDPVIDDDFRQYIGLLDRIIKMFNDFIKLLIEYDVPDDKIKTIINELIEGLRTVRGGLRELQFYIKMTKKLERIYEGIIYDLDNTIERLEALI
jgi:hypothetical protein